MGHPGQGWVRWVVSSVLFHPGRHLECMDTASQHRGQVGAIPAQVFGRNMLTLGVQFLPAEQQFSKVFLVFHAHPYLLRAS